METNKSELKLYYNSNKKRDRETFGYSESLDVRINEQDLSKTNLTERQFAEIARQMDIDINELADKNSDYYLSELKDKDFSEDEMLKLLAVHPELVKTPIAWIGEHAYFVESPFKLIPEDLEIEGIQSDKSQGAENSDNSI